MPSDGRLDKKDAVDRYNGGLLNHKKYPNCILTFIIPFKFAHESFNKYLWLNLAI